MANMAAAKPAGVTRIVFQEVLPGDRLKFAAQSNTTPSGGGARDLRYNDPAFGPVFRSMFPKTETEDRKRGGVTKSVTVHVGEIWTTHEEKPEQIADVTYEPPTDARPSEGRLTKVHGMPGLNEKLPDETDEKLFLLFVQQDDGKVYAHFATLSQLANWHEAVHSPINACAASAQGTTRKVAGWIDFTTNKSYCHK